MFTVNLGTGYHQQDTSYYCGAAVAQMILHGIGGPFYDQDALYTSNHNHNTQAGWYTDPNGLNYTLNALKPGPPTFTNFFVVFTKDTELEGSEKIVYTLWHYQVPTGTLVYGCGHWVCMVGVSTDVPPAVGSPYSINGFWINNPWPPTPMPGPPPPHKDGDACGGGGVRGVANEYVVYDPAWKDTYFTGCDVWGVGHPQFVSVCDPSPPQLGTLEVRRKQPRMGEPIIAPQEASRRALTGARAHGLAEDKRFAAALNRARARPPILVQRLDLEDSFYYLVPVASRSRISALLSIDAVEGDFRGGQVLEGRNTWALPTRKQVEARLLAEPIPLDGELGRLRVRPEALCVYPTLVWRPCRESRSPYYPFYMVTVGSHQIYVGYDGSVYSHLTDLGRG